MLRSGALASLLGAAVAVCACHLGPAASCSSDTQCLAGQHCVNAMCEERCPQVACPSDEVCAGGNCYFKDCRGRTCPAGAVCIDESCTSASCVGVSCPKGTLCADGQCYSTACAGSPCPTGRVCIKDICSDPLCAGVSCGPDAHCVSGTCEPCPNGEVPAADSECYPTACNGVVCAQGDVCVSGTCTDALCVGVVCEPGLSCLAGRCAPPSCTDTILNGSETAIDCGGPSCPACADGMACGVASDCVSHVCQAGRCAAPSCTDGVLNGSEAAIDCGGTCPGCADGKPCHVAGDCAGHACQGGYCAPCTDQVFLQDTDSDFAADAFSSTQVTGTGTAATVRLDTSVQSPQLGPHGADDSDTDGVGTVGWTNQGAIYGSGYATATFSTAGWSRWLRGKSFNFKIPSNARIRGVRYGFSNHGSSPYYWVDYRFRIAGATEYRLSVKYPSAAWRETWQGGDGDFCGLSSGLFTPANVNAGVEVQVAVTGYTGGDTAQVDWMSVIVYWQYTSGTFTTSAIPAPASGFAWDHLEIAATVPAGCAVRYDVLKASDGSVLLSNKTPPIDLHGLPFGALKLKATLTGCGDNSPALDWIKVFDRRHCGH